jgi:hypothetical protein
MFFDLCRYKGCTNMRHVFVSFVVSAALAICLTMTACGGDDEEVEQFDTLTECVLDHSGLGEPQSIAHCLLDFFDLNFADQAACIAYVTANGDYPNSRDEACTLYFAQR